MADPASHYKGRNSVKIKNIGAVNSLSSKKKYVKSNSNHITAYFEMKTKHTYKLWYPRDYLNLTDSVSIRFGYDPNQTQN